MYPKTEYPQLVNPNKYQPKSWKTKNILKKTLTQNYTKLFNFNFKHQKFLHLDLHITSNMWEYSHGLGICPNRSNRWSYKLEIKLIDSSAQNRVCSIKKIQLSCNDENNINTHFHFQKELSIDQPHHQFLGKSSRVRF